MHATAEEEAHQAQLEAENAKKEEAEVLRTVSKEDAEQKAANKEAECSSEMASLQADLELIAQIKEKMATLPTVDNDILGEKAEADAADFENCTIHCHHGICKKATEDAKYHCECNAGYSGSTCETNIDDCASHPCKMVALAGRNQLFTCACARGTWMRARQTSMTAHPTHAKMVALARTESTRSLARAPQVTLEVRARQTSTTAHPTHAKTVALARAESTRSLARRRRYSGVRAGKHHECASNPCKNGGTCKDGINSFTCTCAAGTLEVRARQTSTNVHPTHAKTVALARTESTRSLARAPQGTLEVRARQTSTTAHPTHAKGTCKDGINSFTCTCAAGYSGSTCETNIDECAPAPCAPHGQCTDLVNGYTCHCDDGYEGNNCQTEIDECKAHTCANGATCKDEVAGYKCECKAGYEGTHCEIDTNDCAITPVRMAACKDL